MWVNIFKNTNTQNLIVEKSGIQINTVFIEPIFYVCDPKLRIEEQHIEFNM